MTIVEAIKAVMREAGVPLSAREAYSRILEKSLYTFQAKDPQHVVLMQIRRHCVGIDFPSASLVKHFQTHGENKFSPLKEPMKIARSEAEVVRQEAAGERGNTKEGKDRSKLSVVEEDLWALHEKYLSQFKTRMLGELKRMTPVAFESFARELLDAYGFQNTKVTSISRDGGIDGYGKLKVGLAHLNVAFQCKKWVRGNIHRPEIDRFRGASQGAYEQGIFFTTGMFSEGAISASIKQGAIPIVLIDGPSIVELMITKKFRVESTLMEIPAFAL